MKRISKPKPTPASIFKHSAALKEPFALIIHLDGISYVELKANRLAEFTDKLEAWKKENMPSLRPPVNVRFFVKTEVYIGEVRL